MLLAVEQGNTNTVFAVHDGEQWLAQWRSATDPSRTADEYAVWLTQFLAMKQLSIPDLSGCIISSVVPQSLFHLRNLSRRYLEREPLVIGENANLGVEVRIDKPSEAGADRLVNAVGAHVAYPGALIIVDSGTATNFDIVAPDGAFEGGVIAPGINLSLDALQKAAAKLPNVAIQPPANPAIRSWTAYRGRFVEPGRIRAGLVFWDRHAAELQRAAAEYQVPAEIIAAIIGTAITPFSTALQ